MAREVFQPKDIDDVERELKIPQNQGEDQRADHSLTDRDAAGAFERLKKIDRPQQ